MNRPDPTTNGEQPPSMPDDRGEGGTPPPADESDAVQRFLDKYSLLPAHAEDLLRSGITVEQAMAAGIRSIDDPSLIGGILEWSGSAAKLGPCMLFTFRRSDGTLAADYFRLKPDRPRVEAKGDKEGKPIKYESPIGKPNRAYFPPGVSDQLVDPNTPLVITEGEKKALKATLDGFPAIGLVGVWGWQRKRERDASDRGVGERQLIPDLETVAWIGRSVAIIFDSDAAQKPEVRQAETALAQTLIGRGAVVRIVRLPDLPNHGVSQ